MRRNPQSEYHRRELQSFKRGSHAFFDRPKELSDQIVARGYRYLIEQFEWIENGSYGMGAALALKEAYDWGRASKRRNLEAAVGGVFLQALYGKPYRWQSLSKRAQSLVSAATRRWLRSSKSWPF